MKDSQIIGLLLLLVIVAFIWWKAWHKPPKRSGTEHDDGVGGSL